MEQVPKSLLTKLLRIKMPEWTAPVSGPQSPIAVEHDATSTDLTPATLFHAVYMKCVEDQPKKFVDIQEYFDRYELSNNSLNLCMHDRCCAKVANKTMSRTEAVSWLTGNMLV